MTAAAAVARPRVTVAMGMQRPSPASRPAAASVAVVRGLAGLLPVRLASMADGGSHRRNPDLAVAVIKPGVLAPGVLALLRCPCRVHCLSLRSVLGCQRAAIWSPTGAELRTLSYPALTICCRLLPRTGTQRARLVWSVKTDRPLITGGQGRPHGGRATALELPPGKCGILATGPQEGPANAPEIVALARVFRLIASSGFRVECWRRSGK
jgi:hypothetical protein